MPTAFIADYIAYYQTLGFEHFYTYMLDPGPRTLRALRRVANADASVQPVRFALHQGLKGHRSNTQWKPTRSFQVEPSRWNLPGIEPLDQHIEFEMADGSQAGDMRLW